jgi:hypothetical protein
MFGEWPRNLRKALNDGGSLVAKLGVAGLLGTAATTWIQERGWEWESRSATIKADTDGAAAANASVSDLVNARYHAFFGVVKAIETAQSGEEWNAARAEFIEADRNWATRFGDSAFQVFMAADLPFRIDVRGKLDPVWSLTCHGNPFVGGVPTGSALAALQVVNHCFGLIKDDIDKYSGFNAEQPPKLTDEDRKTFVDRQYDRLSVVYNADETLHCLILGRARSVHDSLQAGSYVHTLLGHSPLRYRLPDESACAPDAPRIASSGVQQVEASR